LVQTLTFSRKGAKAQRGCHCFRKLCVFAAWRESSLSQRNKGLAKGEGLEVNSEPRKEFAMTENEIAKSVVDAAFEVHTKLGPGLLESVYQIVLAALLRRRGLQVEQQVPVPIRFDDLQFDEGFRADLIVERKVILELKSVEETAPVHKKQVITYIRLADKRLGLLVNFGAPLIKDGITRLVNGLPE
jgi:GxxExxY protein